LLRSQSFLYSFAMNNNKRQRTDEEDVSPAPSSSITVRVPKLRLSDELTIELGTRYCTDIELVTLMLSQKMCSRVSTFEVKATLMGDLNEWMPITLDDDHASTADVKAGVEQAKGTRPATQELFRYDESWTGTKGGGGSGHSVAQEDAALVEEGVLFEGPCSLMVSVNESYAVVLEGQEEGELSHEDMGVYERVEGKEMNGRGVWQALGGMDCFLYYYSTKKRWMVSDREGMEAGNGKGFMVTKSTAATPDQITERWKVGDGTGLQYAPKLRVRVCSSVEKHAAEQRVEQEQAQALEQAQQSRQLVFEGLANDQYDLMGVYQLMGGKVVNGRAVWQKQGGDEVWQKQGGDEDWFLYNAGNSKWLVSTRENMEKGKAAGFMFLATAALTPDQARPSEMCRVDDGRTRTFVEVAEARFVISHQLSFVCRCGVCMEAPPIPTAVEWRQNLPRPSNPPPPPLLTPPALVVFIKKKEAVFGRRSSKKKAASQLDSRLIGTRSQRHAFV
jgi:hypothetical protein